jgi:thioredoxin-dependent peroxiredoxin
MATITFKGDPIHTEGDLPRVGAKATAFRLTGGDLQDVGLEAFKGKTVILNIVPSLDTGVCAQSARAFNTQAGALSGVVVVNVSADLPFAQKRFCDAEGLAHVRNLSVFRAPAFGRDYGVRIADGPLAGLLSRAVVVIAPDGVVAYTEQVPEIAQEPDYAAALAAARRAS